MSIHQIPPRTVSFRGKALPTYPAQVEVTAQLGPAELFGGAALSGRLRLSPPGKTVTFETESMHGGIRKRQPHRLSKPSVTTVLFDLPMSLEGNLATVRAELSSEESLKRCIDTVANYLPSFLSSALDAPVEIEDLFGTVNDQYFETRVTGVFEHHLATVPVDRAVQVQLELLKTLPRSQSRRVFMALRYLNQARWLEYQATYPTQFAPERLLNLGKALEVLFNCSGEQGANKLRAQLGSINVNPNVIEVLVSLLFIRNNVDVGHIRLTTMTTDELYTVNRVLLDTSLMFNWLIRHLLKHLAGGSIELAQYKPSKPDRTLQRAAEALRNLTDDDRLVYTQQWPNSQ